MNHSLRKEPPCAPVLAMLLAAWGCGGSTATKEGPSGLDGGDAGREPGSPSVLSVPLSSCLPTAYTLGATIGGTQSFQLLLDTGSTTLGVASSACPTCGVVPAYTPGSSAVDQGTMATSQYGSGSWTGEVYQDSVTLGSAPTAPVKLVAIDQQRMFFEATRCDSTSGGVQGILGLGPGGAAVAGTNGYFDVLVATAHLPDVFATQLCDSGGTLWLGGYEASSTTAAPQYTPIVAALAQDYYAVTLGSITVNGRTVTVPSGPYTDAIVDTGTSAFLLGTTAAAALGSAIAQSPQFQQLFGGASFFPSATATNITCAQVTLTKDELDARLPELALSFAGGAVVHAKATESYLYPQAANQWCPSLVSFAPSQQFPLAAVLGAPLLRSNVVVFDRGQGRIGFAPHAPCP